MRKGIHFGKLRPEVEYDSRIIYPDENEDYGIRESVRFGFAGGLSGACA